MHRTGAHGVGMHHVAFLYSLDDLMRVYQRLEHKDILPFMAANHGSHTSFYYRDPDNNMLELLVDHYGSDLRKGQEVLRAFQASSYPPVVMINPETYLAAGKRERHSWSYTNVPTRASLPKEFPSARHQPRTSALRKEGRPTSRRPSSPSFVLFRASGRTAIALRRRN